MENEKRLVLAIVLMLATVFVVNLLFPPGRPPETGIGEDTTAVRHETFAPAEESVPQAGAPTPAEEEARPLRQLVPPVEPEEEDTAWVTTPHLRLGFAQRGARLVSAEMLGFESLADETKGEPVQLVPPGTEDFFSHQWVVGDDTLDLRDVHFEMTPRRLDLIEGGPARTLTLTYRHAGSPFRVDLNYSFHPDSYTVHLEGRLSGVPATGWWLMGLGSGLQSNEWDPESDYKANLAFAAKGPDGVQSRKIRDVEPGERVALDGPFDWAAVRTKYFVTALALPLELETEARLSGLMITGTADPNQARGIVSFPMSRDGDFHYQVYIGPQDPGKLARAGRDLDQVLPFGYKWLQPILRPLAGAITALLVWSHNVLGLGYGWVLVLFGIGIRVVLFPLYQKSMRSQMAMMRVQPLMKETQEKYKNDPQRLQQEMMKIYREHKVNPLGGCLPMLLPFPILIALFFVFRDTIEFRGVPFLWLPDLSRPDPLYIIPLLMGASLFLMQWLGQRSMPQSNPQMKVMMWVMPVMLVVLFLKFAAGLNLYYATMNLASLPQQLYLNKERRKAAGKPPPDKKKN
ncbi:MAG: membrane protein insertase YidC [Gemmatimonadota bacterium]|nr:MAG: membrane protein insertase YidC [Gemmatimonadota bacterium]